MGAQVVFAVYQPNKGGEKAMEKLIAQHVVTLQKLGLATKREPVLVRSRNGAFVEVFEWVSEESAQKAHEHPAVAKTWEAMAKVGTFPGMQNLPEVKDRFAHFEPVKV